MAAKSRGMTVYRGEMATSLAQDGMMTPPELNPEISSVLDLRALAGGSEVDVLFKGDGFSLVRARFKAGYRLPRHTHSAECLYYVVRGQAVMGSQTLDPGDGFFVPDGAPYAYEAGPDGVEVLEFRSATSFDIQVLDQTVERWRPIVESALTNRERWVTQEP